MVDGRGATKTPFSQLSPLYRQPLTARMISIDPQQHDTISFNRLLTGAVAPRPIAWVSSISAQGQVNLSPYSFFNVFSYRPPILIFSIARRMRDNTTKDTLANVQEVPEVVIQMVSYDQVEQMSLTSTEYERGVDEFEKAGLEAVASERVQPPRVGGAPAAFECKVTQILPLGEQGGAGTLIVCEVILAHFSDGIMAPDGSIDPFRLNAVARMGNNWYCRAQGDAIFEIEKPGRQLGIGVDQLPAPIRNSKILSGNDLGRLGILEGLPTENLLATLKLDDRVRPLFENKASEEQWHRLAKEMIARGEREKALGTLLLSLEILT